MIQYLVTLVLCSPALSQSRETLMRKGKLRIKPEERARTPTTADLLAAHGFLDRLVELYPGELIAALPPYVHADPQAALAHFSHSAWSRKSTGEATYSPYGRASSEVPPHPASTFFSSAVGRSSNPAPIVDEGDDDGGGAGDSSMLANTSSSSRSRVGAGVQGGLDDDAISASSRALKAYVWDHLMHCRNVFKLLDLKDEYWQVANDVAAAEASSAGGAGSGRGKVKRIKLTLKAPGKPLETSSALAQAELRRRDLSGFWNVMALAVRAWRAQHAFVRARLRTRAQEHERRSRDDDDALPPPAVRLTPMEAAPLSLYAQLLGRIPSVALRPTPARQLNELLQIITLGLATPSASASVVSSHGADEPEALRDPVARPVQGLVVAHPRSIALDMLQETFLLLEVGLVDAGALQQWLAASIGPALTEDAVEAAQDAGKDARHEALKQGVRCQSLRTGWSLADLRAVELVSHVHRLSLEKPD